MHRCAPGRALRGRRPPSEGRRRRRHPPFFALVLALAVAAVCLPPGAARTGEETIGEYVILSGNAGKGAPLGVHRLDGSGASPATPYELLAATRNQARTARGLASLPAGDPLRRAVDALAVGRAAGAYDSLGGAHYANLSTMVQLRDIGFGAGLFRRQSSLIAKLGYADNPIIPTVVPQKPPPEPAACDPCAEFARSPLALPSLALPIKLVSQFWAQLDADSYRLDADGNGPKSKLYGSGVSLGYEFATITGWLGGAAFRYGDMTLKSKSLHSETDLDSFSFALYGGKVLNNRYGPLLLSMGTSYTRHLLDSSRDVVLGAFRDSLEARHHADSFQVFAEAAQSFYVGRAVVEPFLSASWSHFRAGGVRERGGAAALMVRSANHNNLATVLGVRSYMPLSERFGIDASLGWRHWYGPRRPSADAFFRSGGDVFGVRGTAADRDALMMSATLDVVLYPRLVMKLGYDGSIGDRGSGHAGVLRLVYGF